MNTELALINKLLSGLFAVLVVSGCTNVAQVKNQPLSDPDVDQQYSLRTWKEASKYEEVSILLTFSGGGTRAAALAYGVMQELRDTSIVIDGHSERLLDQVKNISSVSGGSFTAAYYGLYGDGLFETFESDFLRVDLDKPLELILLNPVLWVTKESRTDKAIEYYEKHIFHNATFADLIKPDRPVIIINSTDLGYGIRFSFLQEYFDLLCSDLASFSVARAVAASSAVPVLFEPVVLENFSGCDNQDFFEPLRARAANLAMQGKHDSGLVAQLETYSDKEKRKYIHLMDGGLVDNLGLRAMSDVFEVYGGADGYFQGLGHQPPRRLVVIEVNAATDSHRNMDLSPEEPHIAHVISAVSDLQILRIDADSINLIGNIMDSWAQQLSTPLKPVSAHFIQVSLTGPAAKEHFLFDKLPDNFISSIPTNFSLSDEQVDRLITEGRHLLRLNPDFQELLSELGNP